MSERGPDGELRVLAGGKRGDLTAAELVDSLKVAAGHLREGNRLLKERFESPPAAPAARRPFRDAVGWIRGARSGRSSRPAYESRAADSLPKLDDRRRFEALVSERAYQFGRRDAARREVFGRAGSLALILDGWLRQRIAQVRLGELERKAALEAEIASAPLEVDTQRERIRMHHKRSTELDDEIAIAEARVAEMVEEEQSLGLSRRTGRVVGVEASTAALATGLADSATFLLAIDAVGGALWLRLGIATAVALALTVAVMAAGRTLTGLWLMMRPRRRWVRASLVASVFGALCLLIVGSLSSARSFRKAAFADIEQGLPANPDFLMWTAVTAAFGAVLMLAWWHYASEADRLSKRRRQFEVDVAALTAERARSRTAVETAQDAVGAILVATERAAAELKLLSIRTERLIEHEHADAALLLAVAEAEFKRGRHELRRFERDDRASTLDPDVEREIDRQLDVIIGGEERSLRVVSEEDETGEEQPSSG